MDAMLDIDVVQGPLPVVVYAIAVALLVFLLVRPLRRPWVVRLALAVAGGGVVAVALWLVCVRWLDLFGGSLGLANYAWLAVTCAAVGVAIVSMWSAPRRRIVVAAASIPVFLIGGALAINATFGLDRTLGGVLAIVVPRPIALTPPTGADDFDGHLWRHWHEPAGMPVAGTTGTAVIPGVASGFTARPAGIYLPPAALTRNAPRLPLVVMMMGQPGNPDPQWIAGTLDRYAAKHHGLAPIVVVADQLGPAIQDTLCLDTKSRGNVETYVTRDVTAWAVKHLKITTDHRFWTVAGYSNGGLCAFSFGVKHPDLYRNILDISGEEFAGAERPEQTLREIFGGRQDLYEAEKPLTILKRKRLANSTAIFTASVDDPGYLAVARKTALGAKSAGMTVQLDEFPTGGHAVGTLALGLDAGFKVLYPVLGLQPPG